MKLNTQILVHVLGLGRGWTLAIFDNTAQADAIKSDLRRNIGSKRRYSICAQVLRNGGRYYVIIN